MKYGQIVGSDSVNDAIYSCFKFVSEADAKAYVKKFAKQPHDQDQVKHTFRELVLGTFLASNGLTVQSDRRFDGKTPDWTILDNGDPKCVVEVATFHINKEIKDAIEAQLGATGFAFVYQPDHTQRLFQTLENKSTAYRDVIEKYNIAYVPGLFLAFDAAVNREQLDACLLDRDTGIFAAYPYVSGVLAFTETIITYGFAYFPNPNALRPFPLPSGELGPSFFRQGQA